MDRRKHKRIPLAVPLRVRVDDFDRFAQQHSRDLSAGGLFLQTDRPFPIGTKVDVQFYFRREKKKIPVKGVVVRAVTKTDAIDRDKGVAIEFTHLGKAAKMFIEQSIEKWNMHHPSQILDLPETFFEEAEGEVQPATERGIRPPDPDFDI